jgi:hypothetical protein
MRRRDSGGMDSRRRHCAVCGYFCGCPKSDVYWDASRLQARADEVRANSAVHETAVLAKIGDRDCHPERARPGSSNELTPRLDLTNFT